MSGTLAAILRDTEIQCAVAAPRPDLHPEIRNRPCESHEKAARGSPSSTSCALRALEHDDDARLHLEREADGALPNGHVLQERAELEAEATNYERHVAGEQTNSSRPQGDVSKMGPNERVYRCCGKHSAERATLLDPPLLDVHRAELQVVVDNSCSQASIKYL